MMSTPDQVFFNFSVGQFKNNEMVGACGMDWGKEIFILDFDGET